MRSKRCDPIHRRKQMALLIFCVLGLWIAIVSTGTRLPYLYTQLAFNMRTYVIFPFLLFALIYLCFIYHKPGQQTGFMQAMNQLPTREKKFKATIWGLLGLILIPGGIAWTSVAFPAWMANIFAKENHARIYQVIEVTARSGPVWSTLFDLDLMDAASGNRVSLRLNRIRYEREPWKKGLWICAQGRTSIFGTIIDNSKSMGSNTEVSPQNCSAE